MTGWWKGKKFSAKHRKKISERHKGKIPWNKGTKGILVSKFKGRPIPWFLGNKYGFQKGHIPWNKGKKWMTEEIKEKIFTKERVTLKSRFTRPKTQKIEPFLAKSIFYKKIIDYILENTSYKIEDLGPLTRAFEHYNLRTKLPFMPRIKRFVPAIVNYAKGNYHKYCHVGSSQLGILQAMIGDIVE